MSGEEQHEVFLYIYDMSKGLARSLSSLFLGKEIPGIWHTAIIAYDREYFFGGMGIESCNVGSTNIGEPDQILPLGQTQVPYSLFLEYLFSLGESNYAPSTYNLFEHNCNNFSNELAMFLTGNEIPHEILNLPSEFLSTGLQEAEIEAHLDLVQRQRLIPDLCVGVADGVHFFHTRPLGQTFKQYLDSVTIRPQGTGVSFHNPEERLPSSVKEPLRELDEAINESAKSQPEPTIKMSETEATPPVETKEDEDETSETGISSVSTRRAYKYDDPPIVFKDVDGLAALKKVEEMIVNLLNPQQQQFLKEITDYLQSDSGAWAIGDEHLELILFLLSGGEGKFAPNVTLLTLEVLQAAALKEDVVLILHQDRKDHRIMSYINKIEHLTLAEQEEVVKLLCNLCGQPSTIDWLLYISEWTENDGHSSSNSRVTVRAAVHTLLNDQLTTLQRNGVYLIYNLSLKEVFEDVSMELATALLQYLHSDVPDDQALLCLTAIRRFIEISCTDVPALIKMLGPDLTKYKGKNEKMDKLVEEIDSATAKLPSFG